LIEGDEVMKTGKLGWLSIFAVVLLVATTAARQQAPAAIAFVNVPQALEQVPGFDRAQQAFEEELERNQQELQGMEDRLNTMIQQFESQQSTMNAASRQQRVTQIRELQQQLQTRAQELQETAYERESALLGPLQQEVQEAIDSIRVQRGLSAVLDVTAEGSGLVSVDPDLDLTSEVIARVR
jgi:Skp family chaperone for outer membrane proteins